MLERFVFDFDTSGFGRAKEEMMSAVGTDQEAEEADLVRYLDPRMRDMLLQIVSMDGVAAFQSAIPHSEFINIEQADHMGTDVTCATYN